MSSEICPVCRIDRISSLYSYPVTIDVLRLDLVHPDVSGNKWFKLQAYLAEAKAQMKTLLTFGGPFSNHILATAAAAASANLNSIGVIRGVEPQCVSPTLQEATALGMKLYFTTREAYKNKSIPAPVYHCCSPEELCIVPEGGYGSKGAEGARDILLKNDASSYTHILTAVGTGTTLAGLAAAAGETQKIIGVPVLKNNFSIVEEVGNLLPSDKLRNIRFMHDYHFGGYAKHATELFRFMNNFFAGTGIPTDFVYTGKAFYAAFDLLQKGYFESGAKLLLLHTGGLQGNRSLPKGTLIFG